MFPALERKRPFPKTVWEQMPLILDVVSRAAWPWHQCESNFHRFVTGRPRRSGRSPLYPLEACNAHNEVRGPSAPPRGSVAGLGTFRTLSRIRTLSVSPWRLRSRSAPGG